MMDKIARTNYENRLKELHLNLIRSFDIGYTRANITLYPDAKKPKLMIEDNRAQSPLSNPNKTQSSNLRIYEHAMQLHDLQTRNILSNTAPGRYSPISPPVDSNDKNQNGIHKLIPNPYLPFSVPNNLIKDEISLMPENLSKNIIDDEDETEGNLVINENPSNKSENIQIPERKEKSPLLYVRKPQHRKNYPELNLEEETSADTAKKESSDDEEEEIIDVVSLSPQHTWSQSNELRIDEKLNSNLNRMGCNQELKQPEIISQNCKEKIKYLKQIKYISEEEMNNKMMIYLNLNKDMRRDEKEIDTLYKYYFKNLEDCRKNCIRRDGVEIFSSTNYFRENNEKIDFRIEYPSNLASNNYFLEKRKEFLDKDEYLRNVENCDSCTKLNIFPSQRFIDFSSSHYKKRNWISPEYIKCSSHRDIIQTS